MLQQPGVLLAVGDTLVAGMGARLVGREPEQWRHPLGGASRPARGVNEIERLVDLSGGCAASRCEVCVRAFQSAVGCVDAQRGTIAWTSRPGRGRPPASDAGSVYGVEGNSRIVGLEGRWRRCRAGSPTCCSRVAPHRLGWWLGRSIALGDSAGLSMLLARGRQPAQPSGHRWLGHRRSPLAGGSNLLADRKAASRLAPPNETLSLPWCRPNVGKSTLFNRLTQDARRHRRRLPGLTRDRHYGNGARAREFIVIDTGGFEPDAGSGILPEMARQTQQAVAESDVVIFRVRRARPVSAQDHDIANYLRSTNRTVWWPTRRKGMKEARSWSSFSSSAWAR